MRSSTVLRLSLLVALCAVTPLQADAPADETAVAAPRDPSSHIEYQREKLSEEAVNSTRQIAGEQAVPFPDNF